MPPNLIGFTYQGGGRHSDEVFDKSGGHRDRLPAAARADRRVLVTVRADDGPQVGSKTPVDRMWSTGVLVAGERFELP